MPDGSRPTRVHSAAPSSATARASGNPCELVGIEYPIVQAPMGWIARAQLASAVSNAGGLGIIETSSGDLPAVREEVKKGAGARLALPLNHSAFPRNAAQLREFGAGYTNCAPSPEARLLRSFQDQAAEQRRLLG